MPTAPLLTTPRAILRPLGTADLDAVHALWTDPDVRRYLWDDVVIAPAQAVEALATSEKNFAAHGFGLWGVAMADGGSLIGFCGAQRASGGEAELLFGLLGSSWGQGLATECAAAVLDHLFGPLGLPEAVALTDVPNLASVRVMERLGMTVERRGDHHGLDTLFYRLRAADWRARRIVVRRAVPEDESLLLSLDADGWPTSHVRRGARRWRSTAVTTPCCWRHCISRVPIRWCWSPNVQPAGPAAWRS